MTELRGAAMASGQVSTGRRVFAVSVFLLFAVLGVVMALVEDAVFPFAMTALFLWLAIFAMVPRGRSARVDAIVEAIGGIVMFVCGVVLILDRANVREIASAGRDRSFSLLYLLAPILIVGGLFYGLRGIARTLSSRSR